MSDFVSNDSKKYKYKLGSKVASGLSGFIAGTIFASIVWVLIIWGLQWISR